MDRMSGPEQLQTGGAGRDRTGDLLNANQALSQLSYSPWYGIRASISNPECVSRPIGRCRPAPGLTGKVSRRTLKWRSGTGLDWKGCYLLTAGVLLVLAARLLADSVTPATFSLRKEVIQPQVLLRLPCYDFTPIMSHTLGRCLPCGLARRLLVQPTFVM